MDNLRPMLLISKQVIVNLGEEYLPSRTALYKAKKERPTLKKTKEHWTSISAWIATFDLDWIGCIHASLDYQHLQLSSFSYKSIPTFEFGRALSISSPGRLFERA
ncbi:unnamed protein product [Prunus armeniaca]